MSIKPIRLFHLVAQLLAAASLVACAYPGDASDHGEHHEGAQSGNATAPRSAGSSSAQAR
jgi:hypothetical protein